MSASTTSKYSKVTPELAASFARSLDTVSFHGSPAARPFLSDTNALYSTNARCLPSSSSRAFRELNAKPEQVESAIRLLDEGSTVPFIARYRKEVTGGLDDTQLRNLEERLGYLRELEDRRVAVINSIAEQGKHQTKVGLICTGDQFMCKPDAIAKARADFPQMLAVEMEGAAIGQVCHMFKVPYLVVRAMSDIAGKEQVESFDAFIEVAGQHSAEVIIALLGKL